jgi:hypothetical protein
MLDPALTQGRPPVEWPACSCGQPSMDALRDLRHAAVEPPLTLHCARATHRHAVSSRLRPHSAPYRVDHGPPQAGELAGFRGLDCGDQLLGHRRFGVFHPNGPMVPRCLCLRSTRRAPSTSPTSRGSRFIPAVDGVLKRVPPGCQLEDRALRASRPRRLVVGGQSCSRACLDQGGFVPVVGGNARIALATLRLRARGVPLSVGPRLELRFTLGVAVRTAALPLPRRRRQPHGLAGVVGPLTPGRDRPLILPVADGLRRPDAVLVRVAPGVALVALADARRGLPVRRVVSGAMALPRWPPLAPVRGMGGSTGLDAPRLWLSAWARRVDLFLRRAACSGACSLSDRIRRLRRLQ